MVAVHWRVSVPLSRCMLISNSHLHWVQLSAWYCYNLATAWFVECWSCWASLGTNICLRIIVCFNSEVLAIYIGLKWFTAQCISVSSCYLLLTNYLKAYATWRSTTSWEWVKTAAQAQAQHKSSWFICIRRNRLLSYYIICLSSGKTLLFAHLWP